MNTYTDLGRGGKIGNTYILHEYLNIRGHPATYMERGGNTQKTHKKHAESIQKTRKLETQREHTVNTQKAQKHARNTKKTHRNTKTHKHMHVA